MRLQQHIQFTSRFDRFRQETLDLDHLRTRLVRISLIQNIPHRPQLVQTLLRSAHGPVQLRRLPFPHLHSFGLRAGGSLVPPCGIGGKDSLQLRRRGLSHMTPNGQGLSRLLNTPLRYIPTNAACVSRGNQSTGIGFAHLGVPRQGPNGAIRQFKGSAQYRFASIRNGFRLRILQGFLMIKQAIEFLVGPTLLHQGAITIRFFKGIDINGVTGLSKGVTLITFLILHHHLDLETQIQRDLGIVLGTMDAIDHQMTGRTFPLSGGFNP
mmetsp:Transcript_12161/g.25162  ORF Transcript_12161/g.25162 Transcript_12161/m.25162 type:complete len:267 (+) Transcript_12161:1209-2009(+)